jgi:hypothetical protein
VGNTHVGHVERSDVRVILTRYLRDIVRGFVRVGIALPRRTDKFTACVGPAKFRGLRIICSMTVVRAYGS